MSKEDIDKIINEGNSMDSTQLAISLLPELIKNPENLSISEKINKNDVY